MTQKTYEHNLGPASSFQRELDELLSKLDSGNIDSLKVVEGMLSRMKTLKRKLSELETQSKSTISITKSRLNYLNSIPTSIDSPSYPTWSQKRLSTHLVDYFLRSSPAYKNSAEKLIQEEDVGEFVDVALWRELSIAEDGLREKKLAGALVWVGENRVALKRIKVSEVDSDLGVTRLLMSFSIVFTRIHAPLTGIYRTMSN